MQNLIFSDRRDVKRFKAIMEAAGNPVVENGGTMMPKTTWKDKYGFWYLGEVSGEYVRELTLLLRANMPDIVLRTEPVRNGKIAFYYD